MLKIFWNSRLKSKYFVVQIHFTGSFLPVKSIRFEKYSFLEREFQNIFIICFSYTYEPYLSHNQPNYFSWGAYDVRIQIQFLCTQERALLHSTILHSTLHSTLLSFLIGLLVFCVTCHLTAIIPEKSIFVSFCFDRFNKFYFVYFLFIIIVQY